MKLKNLSNIKWIGGKHGKEESKLDLSFERYMAFKTILRNEHDPDIPSYEQWKQELIESDKKGII